MPAAIANARITDKDLVLSGYHIPKGVRINIKYTSDAQQLFTGWILY